MKQTTANTETNTNTKTDTNTLNKDQILAKIKFNQDMIKHSQKLLSDLNLQGNPMVALGASSMASACQKENEQLQKQLKNLKNLYSDSQKGGLK